VREEGVEILKLLIERRIPLSLPVREEGVEIEKLIAGLPVWGVSSRAGRGG